MPNRIRQAGKRIELTKLALIFMRVVGRQYLKTDKFGAHATDAILIMAVFVGQAEQRPMTATKLADYAGIPRPTVVRKLREFQACGLVEMDKCGAAKIPLNMLNHGKLAQNLESAERATKNTAAALSKLDAKTVAAKSADS